MKIDEVPQEGNSVLEGGRKAVYAKDENGRMVRVACRGWEVEEIVTRQAVDALGELADDALRRAKEGKGTPLEYWMYQRRMDIAILSQSTGLWRWRVRRHLRPEHFAKLSGRLLNIYAEALGMPIAQLKSLP